ncbi:DIO2 isoform 9, partial [Pongo abelii]
MLTSEGLRCVWKSFLLDAYKQSDSVVLTLNFPRQISLCFGKNSAAELYIFSKREKVP